MEPKATLTPSPTAQPLPVGLGQEPARQAGTWSQLFALKEEHKMLKIHLKLACEKIIVREKMSASVTQSIR